MGIHKITYSEREWIEDLLNNQKTYKYIADFLDRDPKTIRNEVKRNSRKGLYVAKLAQIYCEKRRSQNRVKYVTENPEIINFVKSNIKNFYQIHSLDVQKEKKYLFKYHTNQYIKLFIH